MNVICWELPLMYKNPSSIEGTDPPPPPPQSRFHSVDKPLLINPVTKHFNI